MSPKRTRRRLEQKRKRRKAAYGEAAALTVEAPSAVVCAASARVSAGICTGDDRR
jgi:hypothetical protein